MRDLTIAQGKSFGAWWVTKCWIDEMISFMAEQGGFMEYKTSQTTHEESTAQPLGNRRVSHPGSRYSSGSDEFLRESDHLNGNVSVPRPMDLTSQAAMNAMSAAAGHDDSGIGIRTPDGDDFSLGKYEFGQDESHPQMETSNMHIRMPEASAT
jgi:regulatory factor X